MSKIVCQRDISERLKVQWGSRSHSVVQIAYAVAMLLLISNTTDGQLRQFEIDDGLKLRLIHNRMPLDGSPDGELIAYCVRDRASHADMMGMPYGATGVSRGVASSKLWLWDDATGKSTPIHSSIHAREWGPRFSPNGQDLAYYSDRGGIPRLWIWNQNTKKSKAIDDAVIRTYFLFELPEWSPDGRCVYFKALSVPFERWASLYGYHGQGDRALEFFERTVASKPSDRLGHEWLGEYHLRRGRYEDAITQFENAVELSPHSAGTLHDLGRAYQKNTQYEEAVQALDRAINANSDSTEIAYELARSCQLLGRTTEAVELYRRCLSLDDPFGPEADLARRRLTELASVAQSAPVDGDSVQEASPSFFGPVAFAYLFACGGWIILARLRIVSIPRDPFPTCDKPWRELALAGVAVVGIFALGLAWRFSFLLPAASGWLHHVSWTLNNVIIYSPIFILLAIRKQGLDTVFLSQAEIGRKAGVGGLLAIVGTVVFLGLRGELADLPGVLRGVVEPSNATHFLPVFLEGVVVAFLFVRVRSALGFWPAVLIPAILFAVGHIPRQLASEDSVGTMMVDFAFNVFLPATILFVVAQGRDVVWIGIVHYVMDIAVKAFE